MDGPGFEFRWGRHLPHLSRPALGSTQPPVQWVPGFSRGKERTERNVDPSPSSSAVVMKDYIYTSIPPMGHTACTQPVQCLYKGRTLPFFYEIYYIIFPMFTVVAAVKAMPKHYGRISV